MKGKGHVKMKRVISLILSLALTMGLGAWGGMSDKKDTIKEGSTCKMSLSA